MLAYIWDWICYIFSFFDFRTKQINLLILGLDNAGKTVLLYRLNPDRIHSFELNRHSFKEELFVKNVHFVVDNSGVHVGLKRNLNDYQTSHGIVFLVDASDAERFEEAKIELERVLNDKLLKDRPILVLGNKVDKQGAVSEQRLADALQITGLTTGKDKTLKSELNGRPLEIFMCSIVRAVGYNEGLKWLANFV